MTPTEFQLFVAHRDTVIPVDSICEKYLNLTPPEARRRALLNKLPFPTFRVVDSQKAPMMVKLTDLAAHIDSKHKQAEQSWEHSQV